MCNEEPIIGSSRHSGWRTSKSCSDASGQMTACLRLDR
jgi:hypothetical protein